MDAMKPMSPMKPMAPMEPMKPQQPWWPADLGQPNSTGAQNDTRYACFDDEHRLAVMDGGKVTVYDTGHHRINGFGQQQGSGSAMRFQANDGVVDVASLRVVD